MQGVSRGFPVVRLIFWWEIVSHPQLANTQGNNEDETEQSQTQPPSGEDKGEDQGEDKGEDKTHEALLGWFYSVETNEILLLKCPKRPSGRITFACFSM